MTVYFAYGGNVSIEAMKRRCPGAKPLGRFKLRSSRLVFRGVADCIYDEHSDCWGALWKLTPECERELDRFEGVGSDVYKKVYVELTGMEGEKRLMLYAMNSTGVFPPSIAYVNRIRQGYRDFKLPMHQLDDAVKAAWDKKAPSHHERRRYRRDGRPRLAGGGATATQAGGAAATETPPESRLL